MEHINGEIDDDDEREKINYKQDMIDYDQSGTTAKKMTISYATGSCVYST